MPGCPYFLANTFGHLLAGLVLTGLSTEKDVLLLEKNPIAHLAALFFVIVLVLLLGFISPGPFKYTIFVVFCLMFGQILSSFVKHLKQRNVLNKTLVQVAVVFLTMTALGFLDKGNMLSWKVYLYAGLFGLVVAIFALPFLANTEQEANASNKWVSVAIVVLFTLFIGYDVQVLKDHAKQCRSNPDYVQESLNVYLDVLNLLEGIGNLEE